MSFSPLRRVVPHKLPNGLRILFQEDHTLPLLSLHAWVHVGSVDESTPQAGLSHVLEHMVFKGTAHYQAADISRWIESLGGAINAETTKEYTHYYIDVPSAGGQKAVTLLGELLHQATIAPEEWQRERDVILEEIKRRNDDPETVLWDLLNEAIFHEEALRRPVIGSPETVGRQRAEEIQSFYQTHYVANRSLVVAVGDFEPKRLKSWITAAFGSMSPGTRASRLRARASDYAPRHLEMQKPVGQTYLAFGFPTPPATHPDQEALDLLATILGGGRSSRLVRTLREEKKLVWSVSAANLSQEGPGVFAIFAECRPAYRKRIKPAVETVVASLRRRPPTDEEISRAKHLIESAWLQGFETYHQKASTFGLFGLENELDRLKSYLPKLLGLTRRDLQSVIKRYAGPFSSAVVEK